MTRNTQEKNRRTVYTHTRWALCEKDGAQRAMSKAVSSIPCKQLISPVAEAFFVDELPPLPARSPGPFMEKIISRCKARYHSVTVHCLIDQYRLLLLRGNTICF